MKKVLLRTAGWALMAVGAIFGFFMSMAILSTLSSYSGNMQGSYDTFFNLIFGVALSIANIILGLKLIKLKEGAVFPAIILSIVGIILFLWVAYAERLAPAYDKAAVIGSVTFVAVYIAVLGSLWVSRNVS